MLPEQAPCRGGGQPLLRGSAFKSLQSIPFSRSEVGSEHLSFNIYILNIKTYSSSR